MGNLNIMWLVVLTSRTGKPGPKGLNSYNFLED